MAAPKRPPLDALSRRLADGRRSDGQPADARSPAGRRDGFLRETFVLPRGEAREQARAWLRRFPPAAYWSAVESWREVGDDAIEFTMRRLRSAE